MHVEKISETGCVDGGDKDLAEDRLISMLIVGDFTAPHGPFIVLNTPEIIIAKSSFREFYLDQ